MFFMWQGVSGWHGAAGTLLGLCTLGLLAWEIVMLLGPAAAVVRDRISLPPRIVSASFAGAVLAMGIIKFLSASQVRRWPEWVGLVLALAIGYGGWAVYSEQVEAEPTTQPTIG
jgi:hypothetical protein